MAFQCLCKITMKHFLLLLLVCAFISCSKTEDKPQDEPKPLLTNEQIAASLNAAYTSYSTQKLVQLLDTWHQNTGSKKVTQINNNIQRIC